jgi:hypothetical protein
MNFLTTTIDYLLDDRSAPPNYEPPTRNRVDADPQLIQYHETGTGPKPSPAPTTLLPLRTRLAVSFLSNISKAQTEAYYEEIDSIPAVSADREKSEFAAGQWYVIHPVTYYQVRDLSSKVLLDLEEWIEVKCPEKMFTRRAKQVLDFKTARNETLGEVRKELDRRHNRGEVAEEEGYTGGWEVVGGEVNVKEEVEEIEKKVKKASHYTEAALREAEEAGLRAAEEAKTQDEWDFVD